MNIQSIDSEQKLAGIIASIGRNQESWQHWFCLQLTLKKNANSHEFIRCINRIRTFFNAYLGDVDMNLFCCQNQSIHIFSKEISPEILAYAGQQVRNLLLDEESVSTTFEIFDLEQDGANYVNYALNQASGAYSIPVSAYRALDPFVEGSAPYQTNEIEEKQIADYVDLTKVLLVEDDPVTRWMVRKGLKHDCELVTAPTANQSFDRFNSFQPDVVFLDIDLPDKSGREVLSWIMRNDPGACVVMFSSNNDLENISETLAEGASGFIAKPFLRAQLLHYIHAHSR